MNAAFSFLLTACIVSSLAAVPRQTDEKVEAVKRAIAELTEAEVKYDVKAVDEMLDHNFIYVGNDGSITSRIDFLRLTDQEKNPLDVLDVTDVDVRITGNTAIATGVIHEKGSINGKKYEFRGRTLDAFVLNSGRWLCLAIHD